jgi:hypothetical protein
VITVTILTLGPLEALIDSEEQVSMIPFEKRVVGSCNSLIEGKPSAPLDVEEVSYSVTLAANGLIQ